jgi:pimeloyl-ACP methyl ester carboxylesterase
MTTTTSTDFDIVPEVREYRWSWQSQPVTIRYEVWGQGHPILLLPALSTVSARTEMQGLAALLAAKYQVFCLDWVGFGDSDRPAITYTPKVLEALLRNFVQDLFKEPIVVIAVGHAAGYVMELAQRRPAPWSWAVLVAPTWRGPFPTMGVHPKVAQGLKRLVEAPVIGPFLYFCNTTRMFLALMYRRHVYGDRRHVTPALIRSKWRSTKGKNARFAPAAFVTGGLDLIKTREKWLDWFQPLPIPVLTVIGEQMPAKSREEVEILAHFTAVQVHRMPGALGLHEEYPQALADRILPFLDKYLSQGDPRDRK